MSEEEYIEKVNHDPWYINNVPDEILIENPQICIDAIKADKYIFKKNLISDEVKIACPQICIYAVQNDPQLIEYVPEIVKRNNPKICLNAIKIDHNLVRFVPEIVKRNNPKICIDLVRDNLELLRYIPERVKKRATPVGITLSANLHEGAQVALLRCLVFHSWSKAFLKTVFTQEYVVTPIFSVNHHRHTPFRFWKTKKRVPHS